MSECECVFFVHTIDCCQGIDYRVWLWFGRLKMNLNKHESQCKIPPKPNFTRLRQHQYFWYANCLWHVYQCDLSILLFLSPVAIWSREKIQRKKNTRKLWIFDEDYIVNASLHLLVFFAFCFSEILSSSHFKCSKVIAIFNQR